MTTINPVETFGCDIRLPDWRLHLAQMTTTEWRDLGNVMDVATEGALAELYRNHPDGRLDSSATMTALRSCLRRMGIDPARTPPVSELLIAEVLEKRSFPRGCLAWEILAVLTIKSDAPWSVVDHDALAMPLSFRLGKTGETLSTPGGEQSCEGLPVLADRAGAVASPWSSVSRYELEGCKRPLFVCFLPREMFRSVQPKTHMGRAVWLTWAYRFVFEKTCSYEGAA
jgi:DNA/RNA-binding domain of Phe-tRNA-synthetase-like protein